MSLEYAMFRFEDGKPTSEGLSEILMQVCMYSDGAGDEHTTLIEHLVEATFSMRCIESMDGDDEDEVPIESDPEKTYARAFLRAVARSGIKASEDESYWEDWWPTNVHWHREDIRRLARLKAGEYVAVRKKMLELMSKRKEEGAS
jgi:hypothetical protein